MDEQTDTFLATRPPCNQCSAVKTWHDLRERRCSAKFLSRSMAVGRSCDGDDGIKLTLFANVMSTVL